ncbi:MAG: hypothetical protein L0229_26955 [Blastocatellia bacterium]|nr:hypothetical protein [Blastocatellia bacterium]
MVEKPSKLQPAIIGGLILGLLSSIPFVNLGNFCCCLWVLLGSALASRQLISNSPVLPVTTGDGAGVGAFAGAIGALVNLFVGVPINLFAPEITYGFLERLAENANNPEFKEQIRLMIEASQNQSFGEQLMGALLGWLIGTVVTIGFATLGGILGVSLFEKRKGPSVPPPGQGYPPQGSPGSGPPPSY